MKRHSIWLAMALTVCVLLAADSAQQRRDADDRVLGAALHQEEVEGNLEKAIAAYRDFLARNPSNRTLAATAQFHIGLCYEKLGKAEAQKAYQQVVSNYADQAEVVAQARERLAALLKSAAQGAAKPNFRQIRVPIQLTWGAGLSPDGKRLAMVSEGSIWLVPIQGRADPDVAGVPQKLAVSLPNGVRIDRDPLTWSGDGKWIAFNDAISGQNRWATNMYVVSSEGGVPRKLFFAPERGELSVNYRLGLSPNGNHVAFASMEDGQLHLETMPVQGGPARRLTDLPASEPAYSPNGKYIAYVAPRPERTAGEKDRLDRPPGGVWVVPAEGGTSVLVADVNRQAQSPIWAPDGRMIAFRAAGAVWIVPVSVDGKPTAAPVKFEPPNRISSILAGWTNDNRIGLVLNSPGYAAIYTVPASGGQAAQVTPKGRWSSPKWTPGGERILFRNSDGHISSVPANGGKVSAIPWHSDARILEPRVGGENAVSPDGRTIVFAGVRDGVPGVHLWTIPVKGGEPRRLTADQGEAVENRFPCWSSDGKWIAFVRGERLKGQMQYYANVNIYKIPAAGGAPIQLTTDSDKVSFRDMAWSPDGNSVAYFSSEDNLTIKVKSLESGESRAVGKAERPGWNSLSWSPDGKKLAFTPASNVQGPHSAIRIISLGDGTTETLKTGLPESDYWHVSWSPDGTRLTFGALQHSQPEFWFMEDFMPLLKPSR